MDWLRDPDTRKWLLPGMGVKRWLLLLILGMAVFGLGVSYLAREAYVVWTLPDFFYEITLQFLPRWIRAAIFITAAVGLIGFGVWKVNAAMLAAVRQRRRGTDDQERLVNLVYRHRFSSRGPRVVTIGGGTGMSVLLRGMKDYTTNLTAVVTVADDGGSSGRLRHDLGVIPPGDVRNCIAALADAEPLMTRLFQYRFPDESGEGLMGHSFGNLFIVALSEITGSMEEAIHETSRVLAVRGQILPSTTEDVRLVARTAEGRTIRGESLIAKEGAEIQDIQLEPAAPRAYPEAANAIRNAEMIVLGPGSLYSSILPNLLVPELRIAFHESTAMKIYVCNVATQHGETSHYSVQDHVRAIEKHMGGTICDYVVANDNLVEELPERWHSEPVRMAHSNENGIESARVISADVVDTHNRYRHDSDKLAGVILNLYHEQGEAAPRRADVDSILTGV
jgi:uncharacterized cofD-like protein